MTFTRQTHPGGAAANPAWLGLFRPPFIFCYVDNFLLVDKPVDNSKSPDFDP